MQIYCFHVFLLHLMPSYTNVVHVTLLKSTNNILDKHIENKLNIQACLHLGHGRCSGHDVDVHQKKDIQIKGEMLLISHMKDEHITVV